MRHIFRMVMCSALVLCVTVEAKVYSVTSSDQFHRLINNKPICVAYFYHYVRSCHDRQEKKCVKEQIQIIKATNCIAEYKDAEISFLIVNTALPKVAELECDYAITTRPTFMLFADGEAFQEHDQVVTMEGQATKADLIAFIDDHVGDAVQRLVKQKEEDRRRRREEALWWYNYYGYPWYGYSRPCGWGPTYGCGYYANDPCYYPWYGRCGGRGRGCFNFGMSFCR